MTTPSNQDRERALTIEQEIAELLAAGWLRITRYCWKAPVGGYFLGPHGAWKAMKRATGETKEKG